MLLTLSGWGGVFSQASSPRVNRSWFGEPRGAALGGAGAAAGDHALAHGLQNLPPVAVAAVMGGFAALMTSLGSLIVVLTRGRVSPRLLDVGLGFSSGVMTVASFTSLLLPAVDIAGSVWPPLAGFLAGAATIALLHRLLPHEHPFTEKYEGPEWGRKLRAAWLVALAIIIHNIPEGMAIGASAAYSAAVGVATGIAIGLQDVPEGLAVSLPVLAATGRVWYSVWIGVLSGLSELAVAVPTALLGTAARRLLPLLLGFGAGAMMYVVSHEALPESHRSGYENEATIGFFAGFILMFLLDSLLG